MISGIKLSNNTARIITSIEFSSLEDAKKVIHDKGKGASIIVTPKGDFTRTRFVTYNHPNIPKCIGRRYERTIIKDFMEAPYERLICIPENVNDIHSTWQILNGWWHEYFSDYARTNLFSYLLSIPNTDESKGKYVVQKDLYIS